MPAERNPQSTPDDKRLARVEENLAFTERAVEELSAEVAALGRSVREITKRMTALEERLGKALEGPKDEGGEE